MRNPVRSIGTAEILAASETIDEGKVLKQSLPPLLSVSINLIDALDSRDVFTILSTQRNSIDKSIRADVNCIHYDFEVKNVNEIIWIPGKATLTDPGTKTDSPLAHTRSQPLSHCLILIDLSGLESRRSECPLGQVPKKEPIVWELCVISELRNSHFSCKLNANGLSNDARSGHLF